jgi:hypothetical protein
MRDGLALKNTQKRIFNGLSHINIHKKQVTIIVKELGVREGGNLNCKTYTMGKGIEGENHKSEIIKNGRR